MTPRQRRRPAPDAVVAVAEPLPVEPVETPEQEEERLDAERRAKLIEAARKGYAGPGVYDWPSEAYHADPVPGGSASSTTLRRILAAGGPALVEHDRTHPKHSAAFDFGGAAHRMVLGKGDEVAEVRADSWRTNAAKDARREARLAGRRPLLTAEVERARALADVVLAHPLAGPLLSDRRYGIPERAVTWTDVETGETCRAMLDVYPTAAPPGEPLTAADLKTCSSVELRAITSHILDYGYHQQAAHYLDGLAAHGLVECDFLFVFVTKDPPHLIRTVRMTPELLALGRRRNRRALDRWSWCRITGVWPGLPPVIDEVDAPAWAHYREDDEDR